MTYELRLPSESRTIYNYSSLYPLVILFIYIPRLFVYYIIHSYQLYQNLKLQYFFFFIVQGPRPLIIDISLNKVIFIELSKI